MLASHDMRRRATNPQTRTAPPESTYMSQTARGSRAPSQHRIEPSHEESVDNDGGNDQRRNESIGRLPTPRDHDVRTRSEREQGHCRHAGYNTVRTLRQTHAEVPKEIVDEVLLVDHCSVDATANL